MKHADILDLFEATLALAQALQVKDEEAEALAFEELKPPLRILVEEVRELESSQPALAEQLQNCTRRILRITMPDRTVCEE